ncbi:kinase-like protein [Ceratobasidium sp. AG-I]|nr:kinase-like protein [Ceratobasidium sp. AG-I]
MVSVSKYSLALVTSSESSPPGALCVTAPPGSWPADRDINDLSDLRRFAVTSDGYLAIVEGAHFLKILEDGSELLEKELRMMLLAGDCSVTPLGRVFRSGKLHGLVTSYETPIVPWRGPYEKPLVPPELSRGERLKLIDQLCALLSRLHAKGLIHGDVKPENLLACSDGELRFCDFADATVVGSNIKPRAFTLRCTSPFMYRSSLSPPLTKAEDLYAAGISIWEIYTGSIAFDGFDEFMMEDAIGGGARPDMSLVDDPTTAALITSYFDSGDRSLHDTVSMN